ncbi:non-ribosomal peptide synthetase [Lapidilactobacillus luobeiensis]|uniref:non-ribosomal peptide synthetase n=1 Tax=Lapidilactobacillus luobeiensis TaxID=2950371 RepID=UPI0021C48CD8|nr:non-ribosomal peptide synthetase [Lapidilactobacillus luobeiensis]
MKNIKMAPTIDVFGEFSAKVANSPDEIMILTASQQITYRQMCQEVVTLAASLQRQVAGEKVRILLYLPHSYKIIVSVLAVLKLGYSYVPVRHGATAADIAKIAAACQTKFVITAEEDDPRLAGLAQIVLDQSPMMLVPADAADHHLYQPDEELYVLFTSGSTGVPKGCAVSAGNVSYILHNLKTIAQYEPDDVVCFSTPYTFDVAVSEIYAFTLDPKILVYDSSEYAEFKRFPDVAYANHVTHMAVSPSSLLNMIKVYREEQLRRLFAHMKCMMVAGEAFKPELAKAWNRNDWDFRLINLYGPTEATVYATAYELVKGNDYGTNIPIGQPLAGCHYQIEHPNASGVGELVLSGQGIAHGYLNNQAENKKRFRDVAGVRSFRTGDLVSQENSQIIFHGRNDQQVQINGIRVELGEIESRISEDQEITDAVVFSDGATISAVVTAANQALDVPALQKRLISRMPRYMIPSDIRVLAQLPLNASNKVDRKQLKQLFQPAAATNAATPAATDQSTEILVGLMQRVLANKTKQQFDAQTDFFRAGADSLDTIGLLSEIETTFGVAISVDQVYQLRTAEKLIRQIQRESNSTAANAGAELACGAASNNDQAIASLSKQVGAFLFAPNGVVKQATYEALYLQRFYYDKFAKNTLPFVFKANDNASVVAIEQAIRQLLQENVLLYAKIVKRHGKLLFEDYAVPADLKIPVIRVQGDAPRFNDFVIANYEDELFYARYHQGFLAVWLILVYDTHTEVVGLFDHTVADAPSLTAIRDRLSVLLSPGDHPLVAVPPYRDYCALIRQNNTDPAAILNNWYIQALKNCAVAHHEVVLADLGSIDSCLVEKDFTFVDSVDATIQTAYLVGQRLLPLLDQSAVAVRTIMNIRNLPGFTFNKTVGDLHVSMSFPYYQTDIYAAFKARAQRVLSLFATENFRHSSILEDDAFKDDPDRNQIKAIVSAADLVVVNFLGRVTNQELEAFRRDVVTIQKRLNASDPRVYVTAVENKGTLAIFNNRGLR